MGPTVAEIDQIYNALKTERAQWEVMWQEMATYFRPERANFDEKDTSGHFADPNVADSTGAEAVDLASDGFSSYMCNMVTPWKALRAPDGVAGGDLQVSNMILEKWDKHLDKVFGSTDFFPQANEMVRDVWGLHTGVMMVTQDYANKKLSYQVLHPKQCFLRENEFKVVDTIIRTFYLTKRNLVSKFRNCPEGYKQEVKENKDPEAKILIKHAILPSQPDGLGRKFVSVYYLGEGGKEKVELERMMLFNFQAICWRYSVNSDEVYGRGPVNRVMSENRVLQQIVKGKLKFTQKATDPPYATSAAVDQIVSFNPGANNRILAPNVPKPEYMGPNMSAFPYLLEEVQQYRATINRALHADFFRILMESPQAMTATEYLGKQSEMAARLGVTTGRMTTEFLIPAIKTTLLMEAEAGRLPMPPGMSVARLRAMVDSLKIEFLGMLPVLQKQHTINQSIQQTLALASGAAQIMGPEVLIRFKPEAWGKRIATNNGIPEELLNSDSEVRGIRQAQAQAQAEAKKMAEQEIIAKGAGNLSKAPEEGSPMARLGAPK